MIKIYSTPEETVTKFAEKLKLLINKSVEQNKNFYCALSGGNTPQLLFKVLKQNYLSEINWSKVHFFWGDERCVEPENNESNYGTAYKLLLNSIDIPKENIHRIRGEEKEELEAQRYSEEILKNLPKENGLPIFDLIILGLGSDGHTASIFPDQMNLLESEKVCEVAVHPTSKQKRITLTGKVINYAKEISFLVTGKEKAKVISEIINKKDNYKVYPATYIDPQNGNIVWYIDKFAGQLL